ncbi:MAG: site-specific DNA-methyltransferase [Sphingomicrobium sp.]
MTANALHIEYIASATLKGNPHSARRHSKKKIAKLADSIRRLGFNVPMIIDKEGQLLAGHARLAAARLIGMDQVPVVRVSHLSEIEARAFAIAGNQFALNACWDFEVLAEELKELIDVGFDAVLTGFSPAEIDLTICSAEEAQANKSAKSPENVIPQPPAESVTRTGDVWLLGRHRLLCGDARDASCYSRLLEGEKADVVFTDPPYNVAIPGHVSGLGKVRHGNFAMACGEMSEEEFVGFLALTLCLVAQSCRDGAIAYVCMDWRHVGELLDAGKAIFSEHLNICVWDKLRGGMGGLYRSRHELVAVFKVGGAPHTNNVNLGATGRNRTNVWPYHGVNALSTQGAEALEMHPTVKPVELVADALKDCSRRGEIVLDPFAGSGTTAIAAEKCGRVARLIEYEPRYCDTIVGRFERYTGRQATLAGSGETFEDVAAQRPQSAVGEAA